MYIGTLIPATRASGLYTCTAVYFAHERKNQEKKRASFSDTPPPCEESCEFHAELPFRLNSLNISGILPCLLLIVQPPQEQQVWELCVVGEHDVCSLHVSASLSENDCE